MKLVIITGMSGAGKSYCINFFEDIGYYCVDNLPPTLIPKFAELLNSNENKMDKAALVTDIRVGQLFNEIFQNLDELNKLNIDYEILFLEAADEILIKRFKETRRMHPLSPDGRIMDGIKQERKMLTELKERADNIIDTSNILPRQLKQEINKLFVEGKNFSSLVINIVSFGFKYGIPTDCDLVFDVRFIPNPYYIEELRSQTGLQEPVSNFVFNYSQTNKFVRKLKDMLTFLIPHYVSEGKNQLVIGLGCTGGRHRSVAIAAKLYHILEMGNQTVYIDHRDINNDLKRKSNK